MILAAAAVAVVLIAWARSSGKLPAFFDQRDRQRDRRCASRLSALVEHGTAAVEFALVLPLVLVVALALVQTGLLVRDRLLVEAAARAGARAAAVQDDPSAIRSAALAAAPSLDEGALELIDLPSGSFEASR